ncbi:MAG: hypothetical protein NZU63_13030 [Gemmataceae bacterium]|nr:hypothetical protein [Gemmataceae bacterium]
MNNILLEQMKVVGDLVGSGKMSWIVWSTAGVY